ncbi:DUF3159 domain-containing protein [Actinomadura oligospora]|uniref:DUF3159 domain-containing protein n=1 Tax=Actinomadura oligospora TaxID=111804 RepID=UPI0004B93AC7|nr:DUF3159 domain-containing protein [Actinomadura oligospora]
MAAGDTASSGDVPSPDASSSPAAPGHAGFETVEEVIRAQLTKVFGGRRGVVEGAVPTIAFTGGWVITHDLRLSLYVGGGSALLLLAARIVQRTTPQFVLNSLLGIAIAAFFALRSGKAQDAFLPGMLYSGAVSLLMLLSIVTRWPFVGFMIGAANPDDPFGWRKDPAMVRVCTRLSWLLMLPSVLKLAFQIPLYLAGQVAALGVAKVVLGWPAYVGALGLALLMLMRTSTPLQTAPVPGSSLPSTGATAESAAGKASGQVPDATPAGAVEPRES